MNDNTVLRIKVPAHLYESVKEQLTINEAKSKHNLGAGMEVVKEKKMKTPKDGMKKVEEMKDDKKKVHSLEELMKAKKHLEKKIDEMKKAPKVEEKEKVDEVGAGVEYAWIPGAIGAGLIAANVVKAVRQHMKEKNLTGLKGFWQAYQEVGKSASSTIDQKMSGGMEEAKKKVEKAIYDDEDDSEDPLYLELVDELGEKILHKLFDQGWDIDDIAADPQGAAASLKRK